MRRFLVKRGSPNHYSAAPDLGVWIKMQDVNEERSFPTADAAYAAIGRYTERIAGTAIHNDEVWSGDARISWLKLTVVEVEAPPSEWREVPRA